MKRHSLFQISLFFKKPTFTLLKYIHFHIKNTNQTNVAFFNKTWEKLVLEVRSSHRRCSVREGVLRNFAKFTGKHPYQSLFLNNAWKINVIQLISELSISSLTDFLIL